jgi:hypothetical protein
MWSQFEITKERDEYQQAADTMAMAHKVERDALFEIQRELMISLDACYLERESLAAAAKLALDALVAESRTTESNVTLARILSAIAALKKAGV